MDILWDEFWRTIDGLRLAVARTRAININAQTLRESSASVVQQYFRSVRPELIKIKVDSNLLSTMDLHMQELLRLSQGRNQRRSYLRILNLLRSIRSELAAQREINIGQIGENNYYTETEIQIINTLEAMLPYSAKSYKQVVLDLKDPSRFSWRGSAVELREIMREVLDHLAPDNSVMVMPGFKLESDQTHPTMKQKATFVLKSRQLPQSSRKVPQDLTNLIDISTASFVRSTYVRGSVSSHTSPSKEEVIRLKRYADNVLMELLETGSN
jgi:hypothetical protein